MKKRKVKKKERDGSSNSKVECTSKFWRSTMATDAIASSLAKKAEDLIAGPTLIEGVERINVVLVHLQ